MVRVIGHKMARPDSPDALLENLAIGSTSESSPLYGHKIWDLSEAVLGGRAMLSQAQNKALVSSLGEL